MGYGICVTQGRQLRVTHCEKFFAQVLVLCISREFDGHLLWLFTLFVDGGDSRFFSIRQIFLYIFSGFANAERVTPVKLN